MWLCVSGQLEGVRQHLLRLQCVHQQVHTQHPKLLVMARNIAEWLVRKKRKSPGHDPKVNTVIIPKSGQTFSSLGALKIWNKFPVSIT